MGGILIYGASGYTGRLTSEYAKGLQLDFAIAGRSRQKIEELAHLLEVSFDIFDINDHVAVDSALRKKEVVLNCAGPFMRTAEPLMEACLRNGVHYLDVAAEMDSYLLAEKLDARARQARVTLMPGCGGSVAMLGCLADIVMQQNQRPRIIDIALHVAGPMSRGSTISASENIGAAPCLHRADDNLVEYEETSDAPTAAFFNFGDGRGPVACTPITLPDLVTLSKSTGAANINTYVDMSGAVLPEGDLELLPDGPSFAEREANPYHAAVAVTSEDGIVQRAILHTVNGYTFTSHASIQAAKRVLEGVVQAGFQTPAGCFGAGFVYTVDGSSSRFCEDTSGTNPVDLKEQC